MFKFVSNVELLLRHSAFYFIILFTMYVVKVMSVGGM